MPIAHLDTPIGTLEIVSGPRGLTALRFDPVEVADAAPPPELLAYFQGDLEAIDALAVEPRGTPFQERVWAELRRIPVGSTLSYGELARRIGQPSAVRAVAAANGANPVAIVVPCHRVIASTGKLHGYGGGLPRKAWLLQFEASPLFNGRRLSGLSPAGPAAPRG